MRGRHSPGALAAVLVAAALVACGGTAPGRTPESGAVELRVFAASSLTEAFTELGRAFEVAYPDTTVRFSFAGSGVLAAQLEQGAPADVVATADPETMARLSRAGLLEGKATVFARNTLEIVVAAGNPEGIRSLSDLARPGLIVVLCNENVPVGRYAGEALARARADVSPASLEDGVKGVVTKVALGEADAGVVYATDVRAAGERVSGVQIPPADNVVAEYPVAVHTEARYGRQARQFANFALSPAGRDVLRRSGFLKP